MVGSRVELKLRAPIQMPVLSAPMDDVPTEEDVHKMLEKIKPLKKGSEEEGIANRLVTAYIDAFKEKLPDLFSGLENRSYGAVSSMAPIYDAVLYLTPEQYEALGSPPLLAKLRFKAGIIK